MLSNESDPSLYIDAGMHLYDKAEFINLSMQNTYIS